MKTVAVVGLWHLGCVSAVGFARKGYKVVGVEFDPEKLASLQEGKPPLFEPYLEAAMGFEMRARTLTFQATIPPAADWVVVAYDCPVDNFDVIDVSPVRHAVAQARYWAPEAEIVVTSPVPVGTCSELGGDVCYVPENLKLGNALDRFDNPEFLVFGADDPEGLRSLQELYAPFVCEKRAMTVRSAEMFKHALNVHMALDITFANTIAGYCDAVGADAVEIGEALKLDSRVGRKAPLRPGLGFSGATLAKDIRALAGIDSSPALLRAIWDQNQASFAWVVDQSTDATGLLGLTYKPHTSTLRRSPATQLAAVWGSLRAYDPMAEPDRRFIRYPSVEEMAAECDTLILLTEWPEFRELDWKKISSRSAVLRVVDAKNFLDPNEVKAAGLEYIGYGRK